MIIKKKAVLWEELIEFKSRYGGAIVDRFLSIPEKYLERGGKLLLLFYSICSNRILTKCLGHLARRTRGSVTDVP